MAPLLIMVKAQVVKLVMLLSSGLLVVLKINLVFRSEGDSSAVVEDQEGSNPDKPKQVKYGELIILG